MNTRRNFVKNSALAAGALAITNPLKSIAGFGADTGVYDSNTLTILHTSNLHLNNADMINLFPSVNSNLQTISNAIKNVRANRTNMIIVNSGNLFEANQSSATTERYFNQISNIGFTAIVPGPKDVSKGAEYFSELSQKNNLNVVAGNSKAAAMLPYKLVKKGKYKIGILGMACSELSGSRSLTANLKTLNKTAGFLKQEKGCNLVVCLSYNNLTDIAGIKNDVALASRSKNIDVIISGNNKVINLDTRVVRNAEKQQVMVASSGLLGSTVGRIDIRFNDELHPCGIEASRVRV